MKRKNSISPSNSVISGKSATKSQKVSPHKFRYEAIDGIKHFRSIFSPLINRQDERALEAKLSLEKQSTAVTTERFMNNKLYLNFDTNPFVNFKPRSPRMSRRSFSNISKEKKPRAKKYSELVPERSILEEIDELTSDKLKNSSIQRMGRENKISQILESSEKVSTKFLKDIEKRKQLEIEKKNKEQKDNNNESQIYEKKPMEPGMTEEEKKKYHQLSVEDIFSVKENNFFFNEGKKKINVFKLGTDLDEPITGTESLSERSFAFFGMIERLNRIKVPIFREISKQSREIILRPTTDDKIAEILENEETNIKPNQITFHDIMSFASGRIHPNFLSNLNIGSTNQNNFEKSDTSSEVENDLGIIFKKDLENKQINYVGTNEEKKEIQEFANISLTEKEENFQNNCENMKKRIRSLLNEKAYMYKNTISDQRTHETIVNDIKKVFFEYLKEREKEEEDLEKIVRQSKINKDKVGCFNLINLKNILREKNEVDNISRKNIRRPNLSVDLF